MTGLFLEWRGWGFQTGSRQRITSATMNSAPQDNHFTSPPIRGRFSCAASPAHLRLRVLCGKLDAPPVSLDCEGERRLCASTSLQRPAHEAGHCKDVPRRLAAPHKHTDVCLLTGASCRRTSQAHQPQMKRSALGNKAQAIRLMRRRTRSSLASNPSSPRIRMYAAWKTRFPPR